MLGTQKFPYFGHSKCHEFSILPWLKPMGFPWLSHMFRWFSARFPMRNATYENATPLEPEALDESLAEHGHSACTGNWM